MNLRCSVKLLLVSVLGLPILQAVLTWVTGLLKAMGDPAAAAVVGYVNTAAQVTWLVCVVGLLITLAIRSLDEPCELDG